MGVRGGHGVGTAAHCPAKRNRHGLFLKLAAPHLSGRSGMTRSLSLTLKLHTCFSSILYFPRITVSPSHYANWIKLGGSIKKNCNTENYKIKEETLLARYKTNLK